MDREEKDIVESIAKELHGIRKALEALAAIATAPEEEAEAKPQPVIMDMGLDALFVSRRAENCLHRAGCRTVADVARKSAHQLLCTRGVGRWRPAGSQEGDGAIGIEIGGRLAWRTAQRS